MAHSFLHPSKQAIKSLRVLQRNGDDLMIYRFFHHIHFPSTTFPSYNINLLCRKIGNGHLLDCIATNTLGPHFEALELSMVMGMVVLAVTVMVKGYYYIVRMFFCRHQLVEA